MLSLVLPTYNEAANLPSLINVIDGVLGQTPHEIIVVDDDSPDGTWRTAEQLKHAHPSLRVLRRVGRKGLSSAVVEGFDMATGDMLAVMDADGQHDATLLLKLLLALQSGADVAIGSRYVAGGSVGDWVRDRRIISSAGTLVAKMLCRVRVSDPLGGFFALRRSLYRQVRSSLHPTGFKILLEILAAVPASTRVFEVPLIFRMRLHGQSKLSMKVQMQFAGQVVRLALRRMLTNCAGLCSFLFSTAAVLSFVILMIRLWAMRPLFFDAALRSEVEQSVRIVAARQGWLLSDVSMLSANAENVSILHREHLRTVPAPERCVITLATDSLQCDD